MSPIRNTKIERYDTNTFTLKQSSKFFVGMKGESHALFSKIIKYRVICLCGSKNMGKTELLCHVLGDGKKRNVFSLCLNFLNYDIIYFENAYDFSIDNLRLALMDRYFHEHSKKKKKADHYAELTSEEILKDITKTAEGYINFLLSHLGERRWVIIIDNFEKLLNSENKIQDEKTKLLFEKICIEKRKVKFILSSQISPILPERVDILKQIIFLNNELSEKESVLYLKRVTKNLKLSCNIKELVKQFESNGIKKFPFLLERISFQIINNPVIRELDSESIKRLCHEVLQNSYDTMLSNLSEAELILLQTCALLSEPLPYSKLSKLKIENIDEAFKSLYSRLYFVEIQDKSGYYTIWSPIKEYIIQNMNIIRKKEILLKIEIFYNDITFDSEDFLTQIRMCSCLVEANMVQKAIQKMDELDNKYIYPLCLYSHGIKVRRKITVFSMGNTINKDCVLNLLNLAKYYSLTYDELNAKKYIKEAENQAKILLDDDVMKDVLLQSALIEYEFGGFSKGIDYAENVRKKSSDVEAKANALYILGVGYNRINQFDKGNDFFKEAYSLFESLESDDTKARLLFQYGISEDENGRLDNSYTLLKRAYDNYSQCHVFGDICSYLACIEMKSNRLEEAKKHVEEALNLAVVKKKKRLEGRSYAAFGNYYFILKDYAKAAEYYKKAIHTVKETKDYDGFVIWGAMRGVMLFLSEEREKAGESIAEVVIDMPKEFPLNELGHTKTRCYYSFIICLGKLIDEKKEQEKKIFDSIDEIQELEKAMTVTTKNRSDLINIVNYIEEILMKEDSEQLTNYLNKVRSYVRNED